MRADALPFAAIRARRGPIPATLAPILFGVLVLAGWMGMASPLAAFPAVLREGPAAGHDALFLALVSGAGLVCAALFAVAMGAYARAIRAPRRRRSLALRGRRLSLAARGTASVP